MIVKNESRVIERCLASVKEIIDSWVIVDMGSTDNTKEIIKDYLKNIPGEIVEKPWAGYTANRNEAFQLAKNRADYLLFINAGEELVFPSSFAMPDLDQDYYNIAIQYREPVAKLQFGPKSALASLDSISRKVPMPPPDMSLCEKIEPALQSSNLGLEASFATGSRERFSHRIFLCSTRFDWKWLGPVNEVIESPEPMIAGFFTGTIKRRVPEGVHSMDYRDLMQDALMIEKALQDDPECGRYLLQLGETYDLAQEYKLSLQAFEKRAALGGDPKEVFLALYRKAQIEEKTGAPQDQVIRGYLDAYSAYPYRWEPLYCLTSLFTRKGWHFLGYLVSRWALETPYYNDYYYTEQTVYDYELLCQFAECAYQVKKKQEILDALFQLLSVNNLPNKKRQDVIKNIKFLRNENVQDLLKHDRKK